MRRIVVVGGGVAGLVTGLAVRDRAVSVGMPCEVRILEAAPRPGGNLRSERVDGYVVEWGPNGFLDNVPATLQLVDRIGLTGDLQRADEIAATRFLFRNGKLHALPTSPGAFFTSPVLSLRGRLRVLREPWTRPRPEEVDESVYDFAARHIGDEAARMLVDAMVSGVFAGDARRLSLVSAFPKMAEMEAEHGSLVRAMFARGKARRAAKKQLAELRARGEDAPELIRPGGPAGPGGTLTSFRNGIETLIDGLVRAHGGTIETNRPVRRLIRLLETDGWRVEADGGAPIDADAVVLAAPASHVAPLLAPLDDALGAELAAIPTAGLAVVALAYDAAKMGGAPRGFGFLAPRGEGLRILGCLWDSSIFPGRAPEGQVLLRAMIGGARDPEAATLPEDELLHAVRADLERAMGLATEPERHWIFRHRAGISQYEIGHGERLRRIERALERWPGLEIAGQSYYGISMNASIERAAPLAERVVARLVAPAVQRDGVPSASRLANNR